MKKLYKWLLRNNAGELLPAAMRLLILIACMLAGASSDADAPLIGP